MTALEELVSLIFPAGLLDYFVVTRVSKIAIGYQVYLEEKKKYLPLIPPGSIFAPVFTTSKLFMIFLYVERFLIW